MTRGNQREIDRQRAANRHAHKGEAKSGDFFLRKENDAKALADKVEAKKAKEAALARGEDISISETPRGPGGGAKKKDGSTKK